MFPLSENQVWATPNGHLAPNPVINENIKIIIFKHRDSFFLFISVKCF